MMNEKKDNDKKITDKKIEKYMKRQQKMAADGPWKQVARKFMSNPVAVVGLILFVGVMLLIFLTPLFSKYEVYSYDSFHRKAPPSGNHWFGTNNFGQDIFLLVMEGGKRSLLFALVSTSIYTILGIGFGAVAGFYGKKVDYLIMRMMDFLQSLPILPVVCIGAILSREYFDSETSWMLFIVGLYGFISFPSLATMVRAQFQSLMKEEFMEAAKLMGISRVKQMTRHLLPNVFGTIIIASTIMMCNAIILELSLAFVSIGFSYTEFTPPLPTWGNLIPGLRGFNTIKFKYWLWLFPMIFISLSVGSIRMIGEGFKAAFDPKSNQNSI